MSVSGMERDTPRKTSTMHGRGIYLTSLCPPGTRYIRDNRDKRAHLTATTSVTASV